MGTYKPSINNLRPRVKEIIKAWPLQGVRILLHDDIELTGGKGSSTEDKLRYRQIAWMVRVRLTTDCRHIIGAVNECATSSESNELSVNERQEQIFTVYTAI